jgi:hypothetical protein
VTETDRRQSKKNYSAEIQHPAEEHPILRLTPTGWNLRQGQATSNSSCNICQARLKCRGHSLVAFDFISSSSGFSLRRTNGLAWACLRIDDRPLCSSSGLNAPVAVTADIARE